MPEGRHGTGLHGSSPELERPPPEVRATQEGKSRMIRIDGLCLDVEPASQLFPNLRLRRCWDPDGEAGVVGWTTGAQLEPVEPDGV